ncbi:MAG: cadherin domain-containing protein, partial [Pseudomonadota bacterium]
GELEFEKDINIRDLKDDGSVALGQEQDQEGGSFDTNQIFEGEIAEVRVFDYARTDQDIADNANQNLDNPQGETGLVTNWVMDSDEGGVVTDLMGNNDLVLSNGAHLVADESTLTIDENTEGAVVATLSATDQDSGDTASFTLTDDTSGLFEVVGNELKLKDGVSLDHEAQEAYDVSVQVEDSAGNTYTETVTINVADVNEGPTSLTIGEPTENLVAGGSFEGANVKSGGWKGFNEDPSGVWQSENGMEVWDNLQGVDATDGDQFLELDYTNAQDEISQTVETNEGESYTLSFDARARGNNTSDTIEVYWNGEKVATVDPQSTDWEAHSFTVTGTDGDDVLSFREAEGESDSFGAHLDNIVLKADPAIQIDENDASGVVVGDVNLTDPDQGDSHVFTTSDDRFEVENGQLKLKDGVSLDHETEQTLDVTVTATDTAGNTISNSITVNVADVNEAPADILFEADHMRENIEGGEDILLNVIDPDWDNSFTFSVSDDRFEVHDDDGEYTLRLKDGESLDYETESEIGLTVTATDDGGASVEKAITLNVIDVDEPAPEGALFTENFADGDPAASENIEFVDLDTVDGVLDLTGGHGEVLFKDVNLDNVENASFGVSFRANVIDGTHDSAGSEYSDYVSVEVSYDGGEFQSLDYFEFDDSSRTYIGDNTGQSFGEDFSAMSYNLDGNASTAQVRITMHATGADETIQMDNVQFDGELIQNNVTTDGDDLFFGSVGDDTIDGGAGSDTVDYSDATQGV